MANIAVLLTCYNRVSTTLECLSSFYIANKPNQANFDIYLVDDNSIDSTGEIIKENYPDINVIQGTGSLYWNGGMRLAWKKALERCNYDFYIWLNDDTILKSNAIDSLFNDYYNIYKETGKDLVISGACQYKESYLVSYGGKDKNGKFIIPNGIPQKCRYINGNFVIISRTIFETVGFLSDKYTHSLGDFDYGLRAQKKGFNCYVSSQYLGKCDRNGVPKWNDKNQKINTRIKSLYAKNGFCMKESIIFWNYHYGLVKTFLLVIRYHLKTFFPNNL